MLPDIETPIESRFELRTIDKRTRHLLFMADLLMSRWLILIPIAVVFVIVSVFFRALDGSLVSINADFKQNTYAELVDWHTTGPIMFKCAVLWLRVRNNNQIAVKNITFKYTTYDHDGKTLNESNYVVDETVQPGEVKNFFEQYVGFIDSNSSKLGVNLTSVEPCK